ncbi:biotin synthase BioB [Melghirimyces profundicolus]|uniref:biotin synthase BioB n=1 Tax=Melghirimyces profundicolus TaxID=1242148 RepID=UPI001FE40D43|nr:biotin synthase BioB [Melghirimyces profundicolus]
MQTETITGATRWEALADRVLKGKPLSTEEALSVLQCPDEALLSLLQAAYRVRHHYFGNKVKLNMIINAKSGLCPENCGYCSQSIVSTAPVERYSMLKKEVLIEGAREAIDRQAGTYCIVASGRGPTHREVEEVAEAVREIKSQTRLKICACLGILSEEQARRLKEAGVDRYNHNLNTSASHHDQITTSHTFDDRVRTVEHAKQAGISPCSGCIVGMGETDEQIVEVANSLKELDADSIPVNFLHAIPGTPLEGMDELNPRRCLKILALFRLMCPTKEIRVSGGREVNLRSLQPLALYPANSLFVGDYLTTEGQVAEQDHQMIRDLGFEIEECAL